MTFYGLFSRGSHLDVQPPQLAPHSAFHCHLMTACRKPLVRLSQYGSTWHGFVGCQEINQLDPIQVAEIHLMHPTPSKQNQTEGYLPIGLSVFTPFDPRRIRPDAPLAQGLGCVSDLWKRRNCSKASWSLWRLCRPVSHLLAVFAG